MEFRITADQVATFTPCEQAASPPASTHGECDEERGPPAPMHDEQWMAEFRKQATKELRRWLLRYAKKRAEMVAQYGGRVDPAVWAEELVSDVFTDLLTGRLRWRARPRSLWRRALLAVQSRTRDERVRAEAFPHVTLETPDEEPDNEQALALAIETEEALAAARGSVDVDRAFIAVAVVARLRKLARRDRQVLEMIDAMAAGVTERADLMEVLSMDAPTYARVRRRFDRLVQELPQRE